MTIGLERQNRGLRHGDHRCLIYESAAEQMAAIVPFLKEGLARNECCISIVHDRTVEEVAGALAATGVDVSHERKRGALLLLTSRDTYLRSRAFDHAVMIDFLGQKMLQALAAGFSGLRVTGEMTWALRAGERLRPADRVRGPAQPVLFQQPGAGHLSVQPLPLPTRGHRPDPSHPSRGYPGRPGVPESLLRTPGDDPWSDVTF